VAPAPAATAASPPSAATLPAAPPTAAPALVPSTGAPPATPMLRVPAARLDQLLGASSRLRIVASRAEGHPEALRAVHELAAHAARATAALHRLVESQGSASDAASASSASTAAGAHPALRGRLGELQATLHTLTRDAAALVDALDGTARELALVTDDVTGGVRELRMRPLADAVEALPRLVRDLAATTGKPVQLVVEGAALEADRAVLEQLREGLLHLVRNAVDHGLEGAAARLAAGKPATGTVRIAASLLGDRLVVTVADDGAGLDVAALRRRLAELGEPVPADDHEVARRLFLGGLSTRGAADAISGRGVGLDAVRDALRRARGSVDVAWSAGAGTTFTLDVPLTLATVRALLVRVGAHLVALPTAYVVRLLRVRADAVRSVDGRAALVTEGAPVPVVPLARVLGPPLIARPIGGADDEATPAVLLRVGARQLAVTVDALLDERELVVRPVLGRGRSPLPHVSGAALLATGEVALVLDATAVVATGLGLAGEQLPAGLATPGDATRPERGARAPDGRESAAPGGGAATGPRLLVVDDSITTRTLEQSVLEAAGYEVLTAVDGADGWRVLQDRGADLIISDVEMPRMDGFQLCEAVRASARFRTLPVVLMTALEDPEHRTRGLEAGADAYLGKSSFDQGGLLDTVRRLVGPPAARGAAR
jgi:two-component system chemotaxis sensor kinase CheA